MCSSWHYLRNRCTHRGELWFSFSSVSRLFPVCCVIFVQFVCVFLFLVFKKRFVFFQVVVFMLFVVYCDFPKHYLGNSCKHRGELVFSYQSVCPFVSNLCCYFRSVYLLWFLSLLFLMCSFMFFVWCVFLGTIVEIYANTEGNCSVRFQMCFFRLFPFVVLFVQFVFSLFSRFEKACLCCFRCLFLWCLFFTCDFPKQYLGKSCKHWGGLVFHFSSFFCLFPIWFVLCVQLVLFVPSRLK